MTEAHRMAQLAQKVERETSNGTLVWSRIGGERSYFPSTDVAGMGVGGGLFVITIAALLVLGLWEAML